jgi:hypothetical protein
VARSDALAVLRLDTRGGAQERFARFFPEMLA